VAERFLSSLINKFGKQSVSTADYGTWYPHACRFLKLRHNIHPPFEKEKHYRKDDANYQI